MSENKSSGGWLKRKLGFGKKEPEIPVAEPKPIVAEAEDQGPKKILVIDDSEIDRMILEDMLSRAGYEVVLASDGEEGIERYGEHHPALTLTDMIMPGKSGMDVILEIQQSDPDAKFIAMSAGGELGPEVALMVAESISIQTVPKPYEPEVILQSIKNLVGAP